MRDPWTAPQRGQWAIQSYYWPPPHTGRGISLLPSRVVLTLHQRDGGVRLLARRRPPHRVDRRHGERVDGVGLQVVDGVARAARVGDRLLLQPLELGAVLDADRAPSEKA